MLTNMLALKSFFVSILITLGFLTPAPVPAVPIIHATAFVEPLVASAPATPILMPIKQVPKTAGVKAGQATGGLTLTPLVWKASSEQPLYNTPDGFLHVGQFAQLGATNYIGFMATSTTIGTTTDTYGSHIIGASTALPFVGMTQVSVLGKQWVHIFDNAGSTVFVTTTQAQYDALNQANASLPSYSLLK